MFAAAREDGRVDELDRLCRVPALESVELGAWCADGRRFAGHLV